MQNEDYSYVITSIEALVGSQLETQEKRRLNPLINMRARKAYRTSNYWPRWLHVGEPRMIDDGIVLSEKAALPQIDTFLRVHQGPFLKGCGPRGEYAFYVTPTGANVIGYCGEWVEISTINLIDTLDGVAYLQLTTEDQSYWNRIGFEPAPVNEIKIVGVSGTPFDDAFNGEHTVGVIGVVDGPYGLSFTPGSQYGVPVIFVSGTQSPEINVPLFPTGTNQGKPYYTNNKVPLNQLDLPDGNYVQCYWAISIFPSFTAWRLINFSMSGGVPTQLGEWRSTDNVATPDLATTWTAVGAEAGIPILTAGNYIDDSSTNVEAKVYVRGVHVTYKERLQERYGDQSGENPEIPREWSDYIIHGTYADWLRAEGQIDKSTVPEAMAEDALSYELQRIDEQLIGESVANRVRTFGSTQSRYP